MFVLSTMYKSHLNHSFLVQFVASISTVSWMSAKTTYQIADIEMASERPREESDVTHLSS